jgi:hypothetical protein
VTRCYTSLLKVSPRRKEVVNDLKSSTISHLSGIRVCHVACHLIVVTQLHTRTHRRRERERERKATDLGGHGSSSELLQAFSISRPIPISFRKALSLSFSLSFDITVYIANDVVHLCEVIIRFPLPLKVS